MKSSGLLTGAAKLIHTGPCRLLGVSLAANTDKALNITVCDSITTGGSKAVAFGRASGGNVTANNEGGAHNFVIKFSRDDNMFCDTGLFVDLSSSDGSYIIYFEPM
ncbi:hypothetical protein ES708_07284 [subsurface metagenome]